MITIEHRQKANQIADAYTADHTRSVEYMNGLRAAIAWWLADNPKGELDQNPHKFATCQAEAWEAGRDEGIQITREWQRSSLGLPLKVIEIVEQ